MNMCKHVHMWVCKNMCAHVCVRVFEPACLGTCASVCARLTCADVCLRYAAGAQEAEGPLHDAMAKAMGSCRVLLVPGVLLQITHLTPASDSA